ncbi:hypothetical protein HMN09_00187200 [Mycena chlorophos]|uniref:C4-dicarboxylate transporter/malic acid transport protein n=1 Tax=Mycena chlorophos TaxID=658473 RepID=A0A8H6WN90_MYCCL|nr:hypothetical protein HMN09_00187200 [Mycena chlorophos]
MGASVQRKSLKQCVRHITPAWFTIVMGTGVVSTLVSRFNWGASSEGIKILTLALFFVNLVSFVLICVATLARYLLFPELWLAMLKHPTQSLFISAFPMGACSLINIALVAQHDYGFHPRSGAFLHLLWALWWLDVAVSAAIAVGMLNAMISTQKHAFSQLTALWMMPVLPCIVASGTGGLLAAVLPEKSEVELTIAVSSILVLVGLVVALMVLAALLVRLVIHGPPDTGLILSSLVPLGPFGQGGFSLLTIGQCLARGTVGLGPSPVTGLALSAEAVAAVTFSAAWMLWALGLLWLPLALLMIYKSARHTAVPFSIGYWSLVFPSGVYALLTVGFMLFRLRLPV